MTLNRNRVKLRGGFHHLRLNTSDLQDVTPDETLDEQKWPDCGNEETRFKMVGALPSNRCETCRRRKIKCDDQWPVCGPCQRSKRSCPPRPSLKIVFQKVGAKSAGKSKRAHEKRKKTLSVDSCIPASLPPQRLPCRFVASLQVDDPAFCLRVLGDFICQVPVLMGHFDTIDATVSCVTTSYENFLRGKDPSETIDPVSYARALKRLQHALDDPDEWSSLGTLCSVILLHRLEALFGDPQKDGVKVHASGLAALMHRRGPPQQGNTLEAQATMDSHLSIIQYSVLEKKNCFLASDEWATALDACEEQSTPTLKGIYYRLIRSMTVWPSLVRERALLSKNDPTSDRPGFISKCQETLQSLSQIYRQIEQLISDHELLVEVPSRRLNDPLPVMFDVRDTMAAMVMCHYLLFSIVVCRILAPMVAPKAKLALEERLTSDCYRVWMLIEHSRLHKPLGLPAMQATLIFTLESAHDSSIRSNILDTLNDLDSYKNRNGRTWEENDVHRITQGFLG